ncbi:hypothetical protein KC352_g46993, partial [Hortaea werneckii]
DYCKYSRVDIPAQADVATTGLSFLFAQAKVELAVSETISLKEYGSEASIILTLYTSQQLPTRLPAKCSLQTINWL